MSYFLLKSAKGSEKAAVALEKTEQMSVKFRDEVKSLMKQGHSCCCSRYLYSPVLENCWLFVPYSYLRVGLLSRLLLNTILLPGL